MTSSMTNWVFGRLQPNELVELAYEFGRQYPIETMRGIKDSQAMRRASVTPDVIISEVGFAYHVQAKYICGPSRAKLATEARKVAATLMRYGLGRTMGDIGDILGGRDHTTIMYYLETLNRLDDRFVAVVEVLKELGLDYVEP